MNQRQELLKRMKKLHDSNRMKHDCEHKPFPFIKGIPMVCECYNRYVEKEYISILQRACDICNQEFNGFDFMYIVEWVSVNSGWEIELYEQKKKDKKGKEIVIKKYYRVVRNKHYCEEVQKNE